MIFFKSLLPILFTTLLLSFSTSNSFTDFSGKWHAKTVTASFDLKLTQIKGRVSGSHCAIQLGGRKVDCVLNDKDVTITGTANNSALMLVTFISQFSQKITNRIEFDLEKNNHPENIFLPKK